MTPALSPQTPTLSPSPGAAQSPAPSSNPLTAQALLELGDLGPCELILGELHRMSPAGHRHGDIALSLGALIHTYARQRRLGKTYGAETGFLLARDPDTVRAPDAAFVRAERLLGIPSEGYFPGAPDLAVEVVSPSDRVRDIEDKVTAWLNAGSSAVWVVWPAQQAVCVHRPDQPPQCIGRDSVFHAGEPLPGFQFPVRELFE